MGFEGTIDHSPDSDSDSEWRNTTFNCLNCGNCYNAAGGLKLHMRACLRQRNAVAAEDRKCKVCSKVFNSVAYLKEHMMLHTGEQSYRCARCSRKFAVESKYNSHMDWHKNQDKLEAEAAALAAQRGGKKVKVKEFACSFCRQNFTVAFDVGQVKRRYACDTCRDKLSDAEALRQHKQQVEKKREFSCQRCGRKFVYEAFQQRHLPNCDGSIKRRYRQKKENKENKENNPETTNIKHEEEHEEQQQHEHQEQQQQLFMLSPMRNVVIKQEELDEEEEQLQQQQQQP